MIKYNLTNNKINMQVFSLCAEQCQTERGKDKRVERIGLWNRPQALHEYLLRRQRLVVILYR